MILHLSPLHSPLSKGGSGRGQPPSQGRRIGGRFGSGKGRRNNPSTGKLNSTTIVATMEFTMAIHPVKLYMNMNC